MALLISAGHYPSRPGVRLGPLSEYEMVWPISHKLATRAGAQFVPSGTLDEKIEWVNERSDRDDLLIELHLNSYEAWNTQSPHGPRLPGQSRTQPHGCECWHYRYSERSMLAAAAIQEALWQQWQRLIPGYKGRGIRSSAGLKLLRETVCRAVIVELEFVHNAAAVLLWQDLLCTAIVEAAEQIA